MPLPSTKPQAGTPALISAIVLNYKRPKDTICCVRALLMQTIFTKPNPSSPLRMTRNDAECVMVSEDEPDIFGMEILIVDNHSENDSIGFLRNTFGTEEKVRILETPKNIGYGQGNALAIRQAQGRFLLIINPDNELEPGGIETMVNAMEADQRIGILGPKLIHEDGTIRDSYRTFPTVADIFIKRTFLRRFFPERMGRYLQHHLDHSHTQDVDWLAGACLLMRKDLYERLGGFDPRFFLFFEDTDLCRRCRVAGKRVVYFPEVTATDRKHRLSEGGFFSLLTKKTMRIHLQSAFKYFWKWRKAS
jgi:N-acetylglucosaminyl-diphospho-decaprenol L-rhamnosyltransferase